LLRWQFSKENLTQLKLHLLRSTKLTKSSLLTTWKSCQVNPQGTPHSLFTRKRSLKPSRSY